MKTPGAERSNWYFYRFWVFCINRFEIGWSFAWIIFIHKTIKLLKSVNH